MTNKRHIIIIDRTLIQFTGREFAFQMDATLETLETVLPDTQRTLKVVRLYQDNRTMKDLIVILTHMGKGLILKCKILILRHRFPWRHQYLLNRSYAAMGASNPHTSFDSLPVMEEHAFVNRFQRAKEATKVLLGHLRSEDALLD